MNFDKTVLENLFWNGALLIEFGFKAAVIGLIFKLGKAASAALLFYLDETWRGDASRHRRAPVLCIIHTGGLLCIAYHSLSNLHWVCCHFTACQDKRNLALRPSSTDLTITFYLQSLLTKQ